jgi:hypothetical protein
MIVPRFFVISQEAQIRSLPVIQVLHPLARVVTVKGPPGRATADSEPLTGSPAPPPGPRRRMIETARWPPRCSELLSRPDSH